MTVVRYTPGPEDPQWISFPNSVDESSWVTDFGTLDPAWINTSVSLDGFALPDQQPAQELVNVITQHTKTTCYGMVRGYRHWERLENVNAETDIPNGSEIVW